MCIFFNLVTGRSNLGQNDIRKVLDLAAMVIHHDHGYKHVLGADELKNTGITRLWTAFESGVEH